MPAAMAKTLREVYQASTALIPDIEMLGWSSFPKAERGHLGSHSHGEAYEICYLRKGQVDWWAGQEIHEVARGDLYITRPHERHGGVDAVMHPCELYWMILPLSAIQPLAGVPAPEAAELRQGFAALKHRVFPALPRVPELFEHLVQEHRTRSPHGALAARGLLHALLAEILRSHAAHDRHLQAAHQARTAMVRAAKRYIDQYVTDDFALTDLAAVAGLSVSQLHARFVQEIGLAPHEYRTRRRIALAKQLLRRSSDPITAIALRLGFATSQYFATAFRHQVGLTPREYRALHQPPGSDSKPT